MIREMIITDKDVRGKYKNHEYSQHSFPSTSNHTKIDILRQLHNGDLIDIRTWLRNPVNKPSLQEDIDQELNLINRELPPPLAESSKQQEKISKHSLKNS